MNKKDITKENRYSNENVIVADLACPIGFVNKLLLIL